MNSITETANAKINLNLEILGKRPDGYHEIRSLFLPISLSDELTFMPSEKGNAKGSVKFFCPGYHELESSENLALKALRLFEMKSGQRFSGTLTLDKKIPMEAGLGGGSSDAAATLKILNHLSKNGLSSEELHELAAKLGSDVPFFLLNEPAWVTGRGEQVKSISFFKKIPLLLVKPGFSISTREAYDLIDRKRGLALTKEEAFDRQLPLFPDSAQKAFDFKEFIETSAGATFFQEFVKNDFERVLLPKFPQLLEIKNALLKEGAVAASLTGSGSVVFGVFKTWEDLETAFAKITASPRDWQLYKTISL